MYVDALLLIVQTLVVSEAKLAGNPELAVAESVSGVPTVCAPGLVNVIVCGCKDAASTVKVRDSGVAAAQVPLPAWEA
jgi:hypothetical protein